jgi:hypothetical protein
MKNIEDEYNKNLERMKMQVKNDLALTLEKELSSQNQKLSDKNDLIIELKAELDLRD